MNRGDRIGVLIMILVIASGVLIVALSINNPQGPSGIPHTSWLEMRGRTIDKTGIWIVKTDQKGDIVWSKTYGEAGSTRFGSMGKTSDQGFIMAGSSPEISEGV